jgi:hypothetical protein
MLIAARAAIASAIGTAPGSSCTSASSAEAPSTDAGAICAGSLSATRTSASLGLGLVLGEQLVDEAAVARYIGEQAAHPPRAGAPRLTRLLWSPGKDFLGSL